MICDLDISMDRRQVLRWLGYRRDRGPRSGVARRFDELWPEALALIEPRGAYRVVDRDSVAPSGMPRPTARVGVGVVTIGRALEDEVRRRGERDEVLDSVLLDAFGSAAAEAAADALNRKLCRAARSAGSYPAARISPGYGCWRLEGQAALVELVPAGRIGIRLTSTLMLVPHKSVSFAVRFERRPARPETRRWRCKRCGLRDCPYREEEP